MGDGYVEKTIGWSWGVTLRGNRTNVSGNIGGGITFDKEGVPGPTFGGSVSLSGSVRDLSLGLGRSIPTEPNSQPTPLAGLKFLGTGVTWTPDEFTDWEISIAGFSYAVKFVPDSSLPKGPDIYAAYVPGAGIVQSNSRAGLEIATERAVASVELNVIRFNKTTTPLVQEFQRNLRKYGFEYAREELAQDLARAMLNGEDVINDNINLRQLSGNRLIGRATEIAARAVIKENLVYADRIIRQAAGYEDSSMRPTGPQATVPKAVATAPVIRTTREDPGKFRMPPVIVRLAEHRAVEPLQKALLLQRLKAGKTSMAAVAVAAVERTRASPGARRRPRRLLPPQRRTTTAIQKSPRRQSTLPASPKPPQSRP